MIKSFVILLLVTALSAPLYAEDKAAPTMREFKAALQKIAPGSKVSHIAETAIPGLFQVVLGGDVLYISHDLRYMIDGSMFDLSLRKNLTEPVKNAIRLDVINEVDNKNKLIYKASASSDKKNRRVMTVFTDIDCPYCVRLHREVPKLNEAGIEVRYLFFPRAGIKSSAYDKAVSVWCADNPQQAMTDAKLKGQVVNKTCENPVNQHMDLVRKLKINGTPAIILDSGRLIPGYQPAANLIAAIRASEPL
ncbi:MAG: DsbC family protein [Gammaproteobacteria bacterium]|nr:DsbC family protein [Gammaproteobacteria bacterium]